MFDTSNMVFYGRKGCTILSPDCTQHIAHCSSDNKDQMPLIHWEGFFSTEVLHSSAMEITGSCFPLESEQFNGFGFSTF